MRIVNLTPQPIIIAKLLDDASCSEDPDVKGTETCFPFHLTYLVQSCTEQPSTKSLGQGVYCLIELIWLF